VRVLILRLVPFLVLCFAARPAHADDDGRVQSTGDRGFERGTVEMSVIAGTSLPTTLFRADADRHLTLASFAVGRVLTGGPEAGNLELLVDVAPFLQVRQPDIVWGWSVAPLFIRWNFPPIAGGARIFGEVSGSLLFTRAPVPVRTTTFNFIDQAGFGVRVHQGDTHAWLVGYRFQHVSNAGRVKPNPGANFNFLYLGVSFLR
jgi:Lipid A 3-O-deacylase (PagL)